VTYVLGRGARHVMQRGAVQPSTHAAWEQRVLRHGTMLTALAWLPWVGEAIVLAAGYLRLSAWQCLMWQLLGRGARYAVVLAALAWAQA
jgi:membrane protein YqaA with SNARE-associated domain